MNLPLLDPFQQDYPQLIQFTIESNKSRPCCLCFNKRGNLLGQGTLLGMVSLLDLDTMNVAAQFPSHASPVSSVCFTNNDEYLVSSGTDWNVCIWDLKSLERVHTIYFTSPVISAVVHPFQPHSLLVIALEDDPYRIECDSDFSTCQKHSLCLSENTDLEKNQVASCIKYNPSGDCIYVGTTKGSLLVYNTLGEFKKVHKLTNGSSILNFTMSLNEKDLVVNASDRHIRVFNKNENGEFELIQKFIDQVDKNQWVDCCLSADAEYIVGGSSLNNSHNLFLWDKRGVLVKKLEGPKEALLDFKWHPNRPLIASVSGIGTTYFWGISLVQNFSAFAPFFTEIENNIDYEEKEDEFDVQQEEMVFFLFF